MDVVGTQQPVSTTAHHHRHFLRPSESSRPYGDYRVPTVEKYAYCLCLHVKPTTIFIAVFKLVRSLLFASILLNSEFQPPSEQELDAYAHNDINETNRSTAIAVRILARVIMASASALAIYAVTTSRATLLMPMYSMLLIDFFFSLPSFYNKNLDTQFPDGGLSDIQNYPLQDNEQDNSYSAFTGSALAMIAKVYFLCVIWKCYRFLRLSELVNEMYTQMPSHFSRMASGIEDPRNIRASANLAPPSYDSIASSMKPPNYEDAMKTASSVYTIHLPPYELTAQLPSYSALVPQTQVPSGASNQPIEFLPGQDNLDPATSRGPGQFVVEMVNHNSRDGLQKNRLDSRQDGVRDAVDNPDQLQNSGQIVNSETSDVPRNGKLE